MRTARLLTDGGSSFMPPPSHPLSQSPPSWNLLLRMAPPQDGTHLWTDKHLWKHYLPVTSFVGNKYYEVKLSPGGSLGGCKGCKWKVFPKPTACECKRFKVIKMQQVGLEWPHHLRLSVSPPLNLRSCMSKVGQHSSSVMMNPLSLTGECSKLAEDKFKWKRSPCFFVMWVFEVQPKCTTRMHSSRMCTACLLTVSQHALPGGVPDGEYLHGGWGGCTCPGTPPCEQNDWQTGVKTWPSQTSFAEGNKYK